MQPRLHQPGEVPPRGREPRYRGLPPRLPAMDRGARDQRADGGLPEPRHRPEELGLPYAGPRLRQHGHGAHAQGHPLRLAGSGGRLRRHHRRAAYNAAPSEYEGLSIAPVGIDPTHCPAPLLEAARETWDRAVALGEANGYRNAQVTVLAPTGTIGLVMDCDTTGIEPDFALVKFKKLAGGGYFKIINQSLPMALTALSYPPHQIDEIVNYCVGRKTLEGAPSINHDTLRAKGFDDEGLARLEAAIEGAFEIQFVFNS